jgi:hypothetical protein
VKKSVKQADMAASEAPANKALKIEKRLDCRKLGNCKQYPLGYFAPVDLLPKLGTELVNRTNTFDTASAKFIN